MKKTSPRALLRKALVTLAKISRKLCLWYTKQKRNRKIDPSSYSDFSQCFHLLQFLCRKTWLALTYCSNSAHLLYRHSRLSKLRKPMHSHTSSTLSTPDSGLSFSSYSGFEERQPLAGETPEHTSRGKSEEDMYRVQIRTDDDGALKLRKVTIGSYKDYRDGNTLGRRHSWTTR